MFFSLPLIYKIGLFAILLHVPFMRRTVLLNRYNRVFRDVTIAPSGRLQQGRPKRCITLYSGNGLQGKIPIPVVRFMMGLWPSDPWSALLKFDDWQFYRESFEIIFNNDVAFGYKLIPIVQVAQSDAGCGSGIGPEVDHILHDGIVGADGYVDV